MLLLCTVAFKRYLFRFLCATSTPSDYQVLLLLSLVFLLHLTTIRPFLFCLFLNYFYIMWLPGLVFFMFIVLLLCLVVTRCCFFLLFHSTSSHGDHAFLLAVPNWGLIWFGFNLCLHWSQKALINLSIIIFLYNFWLPSPLLQFRPLYGWCLLGRACYFYVFYLSAFLLGVSNPLLDDKFFC